MSLTEAAEQQAEEAKQDDTLDYEAIDEWMTSGSDKTEAESSVTMIYGQDGTAKSGVALATVKEVEGNVVLFDLDDSAGSLLDYYSEEEAERIMLKSPVARTWDGDEWRIDYQTTFERLKGGLNWVHDNHEEHNIEVVVIDGLGRLLTWAEREMRLLRNADPDEGISIRHWKLRNKFFTDIIEQAKGLPVHTIYIGHEDFIIKGRDQDNVSSVISKTNQAMHTKIHMRRKKVADEVRFFGEFDKNKYDVLREGQEITVLTVDQGEDGEEGEDLNWDASELVRALLRKNILSQDGGESDEQ